MDNKNIKDKLDKAMQAKDMRKVEEIIIANPSLVNTLPEGEYSAAILMIGDYVKMLDDFSAGIKTVGGLPDDFFLNDALVKDLKQAAEKRFTTQFGSRMSKEELQDNIEYLNTSIEGRANKVKKMKELADKEREQMGSDMGSFPEMY